jgi:hypothetical protein
MMTKDSTIRNVIPDEWKRLDYMDILDEFDQDKNIDTLIKLMLCVQHHKNPDSTFLSYVLMISSHARLNLNAEADDLVKNGRLSAAEIMARLFDCDTIETYGVYDQSDITFNFHKGKPL